MKNKFYTVPQLAEKLEVSIPYIYLEIKRGKLKNSVLANGRKIVFEHEVVRYLTTKGVEI